MMSLLQRMMRRVYQVMKTPLQLRKMKQLGIARFPPNYIYFDTLTEASVIADVGCGYEAEFSRQMIERYGLQAIGIDPTKKHAPYLKALEVSSEGRFTHLALAVSSENGTVQFHESKQNESGSLLPEHTNIRNDDINHYEVESVTLRELVRRLGRTSVDILKLDLEGAEYGLFDDMTEADLLPFGQIFLECHHHCTSHTELETKQLVRRIKNFGFEVT